MRTLATLFFIFIFSRQIESVFSQIEAWTSAGWSNCISSCVSSVAQCYQPTQDCLCNLPFSQCVNGYGRCIGNELTMVMNRISQECLSNPPDGPPPQPTLQSSSVSTPAPTPSPPTNTGSPSVSAASSSTTPGPSIPIPSPSTSNPPTSTSILPMTVSIPPESSSQISSTLWLGDTSSTYTSSSITIPSADASATNASGFQVGSEEPSPNTTAIVGGIVGALLGVSLFLGWIVFMKRRTREARDRGHVVALPKASNAQIVNIPYPSVSNKPRDLEAGVELPYDATSPASFFPEEKVAYPDPYATSPTYDVPEGYGKAADDVNTQKTPICRRPPPPPPSPSPPPPANPSTPAPPPTVQLPDTTPSPTLSPQVPTLLPVNTVLPIPSLSSNSNPNNTTSIAPIGANTVPSQPNTAAGSNTSGSSSTNPVSFPSGMVGSTSSPGPSNTLSPSGNNTTVGTVSGAKDSERSTGNAGAVAGGIIGGIIAAGLLSLLVVFILRRRRAARIERETEREMERQGPEPPPIDDEEVYGYVYGSGTPMGFPDEKARPLEVAPDYPQSSHYGYGYGGYPSEKGGYSYGR
ncbi:hypothetical protein CVT24_005284 [Panaeolus cyanescens]|uniref:Extracellular membrane protein CFEM domain-containing protein n=1 Tax=Panaeolus cyanescens TaxID=181874 RepID=A0A409Y9H0_9AGAR|nr:hypothetical protein CVT24_005284 [Panaeolus cyanescens]